MVDSKKDLVVKNILTTIENKYGVYLGSDVNKFGPPYTMFVVEGKLLNKIEIKYTAASKEYAILNIETHNKRYFTFACFNTNVLRELEMIKKDSDIVIFGNITTRKEELNKDSFKNEEWRVVLFAEYVYETSRFKNLLNENNLVGNITPQNIEQQEDVKNIEEVENLDDENWIE